MSKINFASVREFMCRITVCAGLISTLNFNSYAQCPVSRDFYNGLITIEKDPDLASAEKLTRVLGLQKKFEQCRLNKDSVYARILHRIGVLQFSTGSLNEAIAYTLQSIVINLSGKKESNPKLVVNSCYNLGHYYQDLKRYKEALDYFERCIIAGSRYKDSLVLVHVINARLAKEYIYYQTGDFEKAMEESTLGLKTANQIKTKSFTVKLLNERAQALAALQKTDLALIDVNKALSLIEKDDHAAYANNYKIRAVISEAKDDYKEGLLYHEKTISIRYKTGDTAALAGDYLDAGNTLRKEAVRNSNKSSYAKARSCYAKALLFAQKAGNDIIAAKAFNNLAALSFRTKNVSTALAEYHNSLLQTIPSFANDNPLVNPAYQQCESYSDKNFLSLLLANKAECMLHLFKQTGNKNYLSAALETAILTDSLITDMRHEQTGEQSKLYWRGETREFFANAIEVCYLAKDAASAFYFMEKSRAVLLNDKLNELGASAYLPAAQAAEEQERQISVLAAQQHLAKLPETDMAFEEQQLKLLQAKEELDRYMKTLQEKYPAYYQYKYADEIPSLPTLQNYLNNNKQNFVHYFINDTSVYILGISASSSKFIKVSTGHLNSKLINFLKLCGDQEALNSHYDTFASLSQSIYQILFKPLDLKKGRVIICYDALFIPFEALTTDDKGRQFLIYNFGFSYVYSARFLLKGFNNPPGKGNFLGVAPVSYAKYLNLLQLNQSEKLLDKSASYYSEIKLITNAEATRRNLMKLLPSYTIVAILSHASADSIDKEPLLFMADSVIRLSELQFVRNPSTELMVLSACQTNVGKIATGEGVFSLARGFASAGIPSITATLWKADEKSIYSITDRFLEDIAKGIRKDDALQNAKLAFMQNGSIANSLPFYWANMVLAGNGEPVKLSRDNNFIRMFGIVLITTAVVLFIYFSVRRNKRSKNYNIKNLT